MSRVVARPQRSEMLLIQLDDRLDDLLRDPRGQLRLPHSRAVLARGLEPGERVVLRDRAGEHHVATVCDLEFTLDDTLYVLALGVRLPPDQARERCRGSGDAGVHELLDLLGELRDRRPTWPTSP